MKGVTDNATFKAFSESVWHRLLDQNTMLLKFEHQFISPVLQCHTSECRRHRLCSASSGCCTQAVHVAFITKVLSTHRRAALLTCICSHTSGSEVLTLHSTEHDRHSVQPERSRCRRVLICSNKKTTGPPRMCMCPAFQLSFVVLLDDKGCCGINVIDCMTLNCARRLLTGPQPSVMTCSSVWGTLEQSADTINQGGPHIQAPGTRHAAGVEVW